MKRDKNIPTAEETIKPRKHLSRLIRQYLRYDLVKDLGKILLLGLAIPAIIGLCKYVQWIWNLIM